MSGWNIVMIKYGVAPDCLGKFYLEPKEMCFVQYLPIKLAGGDFSVPRNLCWTTELINEIMFGQDTGTELDDYIYLTVKHLYVGKDSIGRLGWHSDGFMSEDVNYIWCDRYPTEFCVQDFTLTPHHEISMQEMEQQARPENIRVYGENQLIRLDQRHIHRVAAIDEVSLRTFVKVSISKNKYNLKGNAHNYELDYDWDMLERGATRNDPVKEKQ